MPGDSNLAILLLSTALFIFVIHFVSRPFFYDWQGHVTVSCKEPILWRSSFKVQRARDRFLTLSKQPTVVSLTRPQSSIFKRAERGKRKEAWERNSEREAKNDGKGEGERGSRRLLSFPLPIILSPHSSARFPAFSARWKIEDDWGRVRFSHTADHTAPSADCYLSAN